METLSEGKVVVIKPGVEIVFQGPNEEKINICCKEVNVLEVKGGDDMFPTIVTLSPSTATGVFWIDACCIEYIHCSSTPWRCACHYNGSFSSEQYHLEFNNKNSL